ncbi:MAG: class I SAM-dependent methyltransferase [Proteobacteria bacterium]|nr:class I SAM-dependent methyltransferase [Pseudomonadota bacterium]
MVPPESMIFVGHGDFVKIGNEFREHLIGLAGLRPDSAVLDVGCGIGRMAIPLTDYLTTGEYAGIDIVEKGIVWCQRRITRRFPNFRFIRSDIHNKMYNKRGKTLARDYRFPFEDNRFDVAFLTSVFTHMLPADLEHYTDEIARVLKPGGRCLVTFLLRNDESIRLIDAGIAGGPMAVKHHVEGPAWTSDPRTPEAVTSYEEDWILDLFGRYGLHLAPPIRYGSWCGRKEFLSFQDIVIATKAR